MDACLKAGQWKRSLELFREMSFLKLQKDAVSCNVAIMASSASSKWQHGLSVLTGRVADEISHTSCMNSCTERKQWRLALIYLGHLGQQNGLRLNSISCNSAVSACSCGDHWHLAWELFACMGISRISTDAFTYSSLVSAFDHEWELSLCTLKDVEADEVVMNAAIDTCAHGGWTVGIKLLEDMRQKMIRDVSDVRNDPRSGRVIQATQTLLVTPVVAPVVTPVTYTALAFSCGAARWEAAENLLAEMQRTKVGRVVWCSSEGCHGLQ